MLASLHERLASRPPSPFFRQAARAPEPRRRYLIAASAGTGSRFLCERIAQYEALGFPMGFLDESWIAEFDRLFPHPSLADFEAYVRRKFASPQTGVFGLRCDWWQLREARSLGVFETLHRPLDLVVHLRRDDFVAQAVGQALAAHERTQAAEPPAYDAAAIEQHARGVLNQEYYWRHFCRGADAAVIELTYEALAADVDAPIAAMAAILEVALPASRGEPAGPLGAGSSLAGTWAERFEAENEDFVSFWREYRGLATAA